MTKNGKPQPAKAAIAGAIDAAAPFTGGHAGTDAELTFPAHFEMRTPGVGERGGLYRQDKDHRHWVRVSAAFEVLAESRPDDNTAWGLLLRWRDRDQVQHVWNMPQAALSGEAADVRARLAACGLDIGQSGGARAGLTEFLTEVRCRRRARVVPRIGWHFGTVENPGAVFVLPHEVCGAPPRGEVLHLDIDPVPTVFRKAGTLDEWRAGVAGLAQGNSRLVFALSLAFAGALLAPLREEGGGVHLRGDSSKGKTTALQAAASVWGAPTGHDPFTRQWRATGNALESTAAAHNDCLMCLDEIGQAEPREIGGTAYMLANGQGKDRARDRGGLRRTAMWRVLFLSTGEESLADVMARGGSVVRAGQEVRFIDLPADAGAGFGLFEDLHQLANGDVFARELRQLAHRHHGHAGPAFLRWLAPRLASDPTWPAEVLRPRVAAFVDRWVPTGADSQVARAASRFALAALAGELATEAGVTGWPAGAAEQAARTCFRAWLDARGGAGSREAQTIIAAVQRFISLHGAARFETIKEQTGDLAGGAEPQDARTINRAGFKWIEADCSGARAWIYGFLPTVFAAEVCQPIGANDREARQKLHAAGLLLGAHERGGKLRLTMRRRVPGHGQPELLVISGSILHGTDPDAPDGAAPSPGA
jgi:putative DNA primase/helicase